VRQRTRAVAITNFAYAKVRISWIKLRDDKINSFSKIQGTAFLLLDLFFCLLLDRIFFT